MVFKRSIDTALALLGLILLGPLLLAVWVAVRLWLGSPAVFTQTRAGWHGRPFTLFKFRTMTDAVGPDGSARADDERMTRFGYLLRRLSIDELPQLWNVVRGDMSLVGPRPLLPEYLPLYTAEQQRRHDVRPGLTGWAQINGRNGLDWPERLRLDVWYVDHRSIALDARILAVTLLRILQMRGIAASGSVTMPRFTGAPPASAARGRRPVS
jgi:lipopolysaccharide/colanic/teichoic acid biosynthesis glycosyltransferase